MVSEWALLNKLHLKIIRPIIQTDPVTRPIEHLPEVDLPRIRILQLQFGYLRSS